MIGFSEGNGHPYSFSAIINGYDKENMKNSGWDVIYNYLEFNKDEVGIDGVEVTHIWTQDYELSKSIALSTNIKNLCNSLEEFTNIDGVIIARDDYESHYKLAKQFLDKGLYVFIDKPLTINQEELEYFKAFLEKGKLMSCSGFRYADEIKNITIAKDAKFIQANVINDMNKYGIHMLDAIFALIDFDIIKLSVSEDCLTLYSENRTIQINAIGNTAKTFDLNFWSDEKKQSVELFNNFKAFKNTLQVFINMVRTGQPEKPELTVKLMELLMEYNKNKKDDKCVLIK